MHRVPKLFPSCANLVSRDSRKETGRLLLAHRPRDTIGQRSARIFGNTTDAKSAEWTNNTTFVLGKEFYFAFLLYSNKLFLRYRIFSPPFLLFLYFSRETYLQIRLNRGSNRSSFLSFINTKRGSNCSTRNRM